MQPDATPELDVTAVVAPYYSTFMEVAYGSRRPSCGEKSQFVNKMELKMKNNRKVTQTYTERLKS